MRLGVDVLQLRIQSPRFVRPAVLSMPPTSSLFPATCRDDEVYDDDDVYYYIR